MRTHSHRFTPHSHPPHLGLHTHTQHSAPHKACLPHSPHAHTHIFSHTRPPHESAPHARHTRARAKMSFVFCFLSLFIGEFWWENCALVRNRGRELQCKSAKILSEVDGDGGFGGFGYGCLDWRALPSVAGFGGIGVVA